MNRVKIKGGIFKLPGSLGSGASLEVMSALTTQPCEAGVQCRNDLPAALIFS